MPLNELVPQTRISLPHRRVHPIQPAAHTGVGQVEEDRGNVVPSSVHALSRHSLDQHRCFSPSTFDTSMCMMRIYILRALRAQLRRHLLPEAAVPVEHTQPWPWNFRDRPSPCTIALQWEMSAAHRMSDDASRAPEQVLKSLLHRNRHLLHPNPGSRRTANPAGALSRPGDPVRNHRHQEELRRHRPWGHRFALLLPRESPRALVTRRLGPRQVPASFRVRSCTA